MPDVSSGIIDTIFMKQFLTVYLIFLFLTGGCKKNTIDKPNIPPAATLQATASFPVGVAIDPGWLQTNAAYRNVVTTEYNSITPENMMKMARIHPAENTFDFSAADYLISFAQQHKKRVHGHTLLWHLSIPDWVTNFKGDSAAWENLLKKHIQTVMQHYRGQVKSWDVVNEAFEDNGSLRQSIWLTHLGPDYVARCFQYAHAADPQALLFYNDYGHEYSARKRAAIRTMVIDFKKRGIPIHGLGLQMHLQRNSANDQISVATQEMAQTGLLIHLSELDISMNPNNDPALTTFTPQLAQEQAQKYQHVAQVYKAIPKNQQYGITAWNVGDGDSWIRSYYKRADWPLLFDENFQKKPAYQAFLNALK